METEQHPIVQRGMSLTAKGEATVHLILLRVALTELAGEDRVEVLDHVRTMLADLDQAA